MDKKSYLIVCAMLSILAVGGASFGGYYYTKYQALVVRSQDPKAEAREVLLKVGKLLDLPEGEEPTVATVQDAEKIKTQPFFAKAQNGHRVVLFTNAKLAILFDEKNNKLINVGTINMGTPSGTTDVAP